MRVFSSTRTVLMHIDVAHTIIGEHSQEDPYSLSADEMAEIISDLSMFGSMFPNVFEDDIFFFEGDVPDLSPYKHPVSVMGQWETPT